MNKPIVRGGFDRARTPTVIEGPSLTKQSFSDECDINNIIDRYTRTGVFPLAPEQAPNYLDCSHGLSYHESLNFVIDAQKQFMTLPAPIREVFRNDAGAFLDFYNDPLNEAKCQELGLKPRVPAPVDKVTPEPVPATK